ncbi:MAG: hypothetical protein ACRCZB_06915 [Bacteroidales bacterium]
MAKVIVNNGDISPDQIEAWKKKCRKVYEVIVNDEGEQYAGYFCRPDMDTLAAVSKIGKSDEIKAANALFENCWLGGAMAIKEEAMLKLAAIGQLNVLMSVVTASLKNL